MPKTIKNKNIPVQIIFLPKADSQLNVLWLLLLVPEHCNLNLKDNHQRDIFSSPPLRNYDDFFIFMFCPNGRFHKKLKLGRNNSNFFVKKMGNPRPLFLYFRLFNTQLTVNKCSIYIYIIFCRWLDSNRGPLVSEATALPTEPHHCPETIKVRRLYVAQSTAVRDIIILYLQGD